MMDEIKVIKPRTEADLRRLETLDKQGKLASGSSYPLGPTQEPGPQNQPTVPPQE